ncbi:hypothetical protein MBLNU230_g8357t1 [Neophaeotheca triangularis]
MVGLREIPRTATFAWSPWSSAPLVVSGTRAGAINEDFSDETKVELWDLALDEVNWDGELKPAGAVATDSGFNDIAWSEPTDEYPLGVIAGALENGSVDLWDAAKLRKGDSDAHISRTTKHSGPVKALQFNPYRHNLLASVGAKGEIFIYDLNNMANPFRLGATAARADDIECLDWNKQEKTAHILATGSNGGFVTVWDVKQKKDILTLNNQGRKAVSAVAWDPEESTKLATATPNDQDAAVLMWSLRNSSAPERTLKGHELGVLGLNWCIQDPELLLSCGKDNRTICWNPRTGELYGDFAAGSNWAFQTKWNPHNPGLIASATFDGKIMIQSIQTANTKEEDKTAANQQLAGEDFFAQAQTQPQGKSFSLPKAPKWSTRPVSVSFGFGGKLVRVATDSSKKSKVSIETFSVDSSIGETTDAFEERLQSGDLNGICESKIDNAKTEEEKADWQVIETLNTGKSRKKLREYLGFADGSEDELASKTDELKLNGDASADKDKESSKIDGDDDFFGNDGGDDTFLADLASTKDTKTNNPFSIYTGSESEADKGITQALMLGQFEKALDICLKEDDRMSDAFMIAVCGGQSCIDKAQTAYLKRQSQGPNYLRLLASIVGKNLWDMVHNADLANWKEVMATLCTYADETEFSDLCEALGDRLEESYQDGQSSKTLRRDASFCYLAGSKLEKVVINWVQELQEQEKAKFEQPEEGENSFSLHAKSLQDFIEKVTVFRKVVNFQDAEQASGDSWKLAPLYRLYSEYADILAAHGQLGNAEKYLALLPAKFEGADSSQQRIKQATQKKTTTTTAARQPNVHQRAASKMPPAPSPFQPTQQVSNPYAPAAPFTGGAPNAPSPYGPSGTTAQPAYAPPGAGGYVPPAPAPSAYQPQQQAMPYGQPGAYGSSYAPSLQQAPLPPPPRAGSGSPSVAPPPKAKDTSNWNDMPDNFFKERQANSRRNTPGPQPMASPFPNAQPNVMGPPQGPPQYGVQARSTPPLPPPPKAGEAPPRVMSPSQGPPQQMQRPPSAAANTYAPPQPAASTLPTPSAPPVARGASPYQPPPSTSTAAPSNRYAPAPGSATSQAPGSMPPQRQVAPNPYAPSPGQQQQTPYGAPPAASQGPPPGPPQRSGPPPAGPPPSGPPRGPPQAQTPVAPPPQGPPKSGPPPAARQQPPPTQSQATPPPPKPSTPSQQKHPKGDRSHIPASAQPIVDILAPEVTRIKSMAPQAFAAQVQDMEKRINILFDHLNNQELLAESTVQSLVEIARCVESGEWEKAQGVFGRLVEGISKEEGGNWIVGVKRLIAIGKTTSASKA